MIVAHSSPSIEKLSFNGDHSGGGSGDLNLQIRFLTENPLIMELVYDRCYSWNNGGLTEILIRDRLLLDTNGKPDPEDLYYEVLRFCDNSYKAMQKAAAKRQDIKFLPPKPAISKVQIIKYLQAN